MLDANITCSRSDCLHTALDKSKVPEGLAGAALVLGFLAMLILDQMQGDAHSHGKQGHLHTSSSEEDLEAPLSIRTPQSDRAHVTRPVAKVC